MDSELIYHKLRECAEEQGFVTDHADELLAEAARCIAEYDYDEESDDEPDEPDESDSRASQRAAAEELYDDVIDYAKSHGIDSGELDHEVGDLQAALSLALLRLPKADLDYVRKHLKDAYSFFDSFDEEE